ncbi:hypothetical protein VTN00DRAFT_5276 [Thermoascus crustaceus]|uniref:uncharacterized protein n=1 Tax=Thermoascus crustaceus TaxID=5088 RepID=UPI0037439E4B
MPADNSALRPPEVPKFPLSSPITEEIPSPTCSSEDRDTEKENPFNSPAEVTPNPFKHTVTEVTGGHSAFTLERYLDPSHARRPTEAELARANPTPSTHGITEKKDWRLSLNLVTNFSRNKPQKQNVITAPTFVDLNDLKSLCKAREEERSAGRKIKRALQKRRNSGYEELRDDSIKPDEGGQPAESDKGPSTFEGQYSSNERHELSPSDRPIKIGIKMPYDGYGPQKDNTNSATSKEPDSAHSKATLPTPVTPSIVITPAKEEAPWTADSLEYSRTPRPASSVYSQPTPYVGSGDSDIPPVPAIPAFHSVVRNGNTGAELLKSSIPPRPHHSLSASTVFEEDDSPRSATRGRSDSNEREKRILHRLSINTDTNSHRSQGWWTYLLSPLMRSDTVTSRKTQTSDEPPPIPPFSATSTTSKESSEKWWEQETEKETSTFSPDTPETATAKREDLVDWPDIGERAVRQTEPGESLLDKSPETHAAILPEKESGGVKGSAAEYYQACAYELFSDKPYFECINHVCSITPADRVVAPDHNNDAGAKNTKGLAIVTQTEPNPATVNPNNPFFSNSMESAPGPSNRALTAIDESNSSPKATRDARTAQIPKKNTFQPVSETQAETSRNTTAPKTENPHTPPTGPKAPAPPQESQSRLSPVAGPPPYLSSQRGRSVPRYRAIFPSEYIVQPQPQSPSPISPGTQQAMAGGGSIPMSDVQHPQQPPQVYTAANRSFDLPPRPAPVPVTMTDLQHPIAARAKVEARRRRLEREDAAGRRLGGFWRGRGCFSNRGCFGRPGREGRVRRRWYGFICTMFLIIIVVAIVLATTLTWKRDETSVQSQWLNLTGYPPMPTGILTIAGPDAHVQQTGCVHPSTMWSCALPKEQQDQNKPYGANQPNFRIQVRFCNGTCPHSTTLASNTTTTVNRRSAGNPVTAGQFIKHQLLRTRDLFSPSPAPPSMADQTFLGNTTDGNSAPFAGEETPFFITVLSPDKVPVSRLTKRADDFSFPNLTDVIPPPDVDSDGTAAPANLYPLPVSQPVRLYNRGLPNEHYGFYTYFDRSTFLKSTAPLNNGDPGEVPDDLNGGSTKDAAKVRCTWAQTRFLIQIWTRPAQSKMSLLGGPSPMSLVPQGTAEDASSYQNITSSSANDFTRPGSFPYPVTITLDRHGGDVKKKMVYCYGMDTRERIIFSEKKLQLEFRGFGGSWINPAPGVFNTTTTDDNDENSEQGFDGGTGGCSCQWINWIISS